MQHSKDEIGSLLADASSFGLADRDDLAQLYRAFLGREGEPKVLAKAAPRPLMEIAAEMARSAEMGDSVLYALIHQRRLPHAAFKPDALESLDAWLTRRLHCGPAPELPGGPAPAVPATLLQRLYAHPLVARLLQAAHGSLFTQALHDLALLYRAGSHQFVGKIEFANREFISGWALDLSGRMDQVQLEVRLGDRVLSSAIAHSHRPDIAQHFGGAGMAGFRAKWNPFGARPGETLTLSLHEASTGAPIGQPYRFENNFVDQLSVAQLLAKEFDAIKARLDSLAGMVPQALSYSAFPLEHFDLYRQVHRVPPPPWLVDEQQIGAQPLDRAVRRFSVLLDATAASATAVRISVDSLRAQQGRLDWHLYVVGDSPEVSLVASLLSHNNPRVGHVADWHLAQARLRLWAPDPAHWVLLLQAGELLDPHTLAWLVQSSVNTPALALYWDEDRVHHRGGRPPQRAPLHTDPILRAAFDPDAMLELNVVGTSLAARADVLDAAAGRLAVLPPGPTVLPPLAGAERERLVWALHGLGPLWHVPQFLLTRTEQAPNTTDTTSRLDDLIAKASPDELRGLLPPAWHSQAWRRVQDAIAPHLPKPLVRWQPSRPQAVLSVLIPTRDQVDLLRQCIDSLRRQARVPEALDILVADNGSTDPATLSYLADGAAQGHFRVQRVDEPFNWSRLNNQMAAAAQGEYLLFLNNDTLMLTREWDDILRGHLERPHVGALGARLLYDDMTIQHAGIQFGFEAFVGHEAAHRPADEPLAVFDSQLTRQVSGATGAFLACRREVFDQMGGFDADELSITFNDVEWCIRLRQAGLSVLYAPGLTLLHYESKSRGFDFMSADKQARAEYERDRLVQRLPFDAFLTDQQRHPAYSAWVHGSKAIR